MSSGRHHKIALCVPTYRGMHEQARQGIAQMVAASEDFARVFVVPQEQKCVIHWARNSLLAKACQSEIPWDYALFIDDDIVPDADSLKMLLEDKKDIVAAICTKRTIPPVPNMRQRDPETDHYNDIVAWETGDRLIKVNAVGTGMMLISRKTVDRVRDFYINCEFERATWGQMLKDSIVLLSPLDRATVQESIDRRWREIIEYRQKIYKSTGNGFWFQFMPYPRFMSGEYGEDLTFCRKAEMCGIDVYVDLDVTPLHMGEYGYSLKDYEDYKRVYLERHKAPSELSGHNEPSGCSDRPASVEADRPEAIA